MYVLPSCVPATDLDESGAVLNAEQLRPYYGDPRVLGLAELMNAYGTVKTFGTADHANAADHIVISQGVQVAVHRAQADMKIERAHV